MPKAPSPKATTQKKSRVQSNAKIEETVSERPVLYEKETAHIVNNFPADKAKALLGWVTAGEGEKLSNVLFKDRNGIPVFCGNVEKQRPLYLSSCLQYMFEILAGHWNGDGGSTNGESICIGRTGIVTDGKHRLIGLALAAQEWANEPSKYPFWTTEPTINCVIVRGVREDMRALNTLGVGRPRSLGDSIYACGLFGALDTGKPADRKKIKVLAKATDYAVRMLWLRTGAAKDAFAPRRTHAEALDFIERHPRILECVQHLYEEDGKSGLVANKLSLGYASAFMYLMATSNTLREPDTCDGYGQVENPSEQLLDFSLWDKAVEFWSGVAGTDKRFNAVRTAIGNLFTSDPDRSHLYERIAILIKAWQAFAVDESINARTVELEVVLNDDQVPVLAECPTCGTNGLGIDIGKPE